jgi:hypothetical protein
MLVQMRQPCYNVHLCLKFHSNIWVVENNQHVVASDVVFTPFHELTKLAILSSGLCLSVFLSGLESFSEAQKTSFCSRHIRMGMIWACEMLFLFSSSSLLQWNSCFHVQPSTLEMLILQNIADSKLNVATWILFLFSFSVLQWNLLFHVQVPTLGNAHVAKHCWQ